MSFITCIVNEPAPINPVTIPPANQIAYGNSTATDLASSANFTYGSVLDTAGQPSLVSGTVYIENTTAPRITWSSLTGTVKTFQITPATIQTAAGVNGDNIRIQAGETTGGTLCGTVTISGGNSITGAGSLTGGNVLLQGGSSSSGTGGSIIVLAGTSTSGQGGNIRFRLLGGTGSSYFAVENSAGTPVLQIFRDAVGNVIRFGVFSVTPVVRATTGVASAAFVAGAGTAVNDASTFDGYTIAQIARAMRLYGWLT